MTSTRWTGIHVYLHRDSRTTESALITAFAPILDRAQLDGQIDGWYFLRYWMGGPHLRLRFAGANAMTTQRLCESILRSVPPLAQQQKLDAADYYSAFGPAATNQAWEVDGTVRVVDYEPEVERYGGIQALSLAESFFVHSAHLALAVIGATRDDEHKRRVVAADLILVFAHAMGWSELEAVTNIRQYFFGWDSVTEVTHVRTRRLLEEAHTALNAGIGHWTNRWEVAIRETSSPVENVYSRWASLVGEYSRTLTQLGLDEAARLRAAWSQLHMFMNRIGIGVADERKLCWLVTLALIREGDATGGVPPHVQYLRASSYSAARTPTIAPTPTRLGLLQRRVQLTATPNAKSAAAHSLEAALRQRRSCLAGYVPDRDSADLASLLAALDSEGRCTYPSPGRLNPTEFLIYCRNVLDVADGTYSWHPGARELVRTSSLLDDFDLEAISPYLSLTRPGSFSDLGGAQFIVFLVSNLSRLEPKYGDSSLKLAWLEAGHVSQTLLLAATDRGMGSLVVAGFDDEYLNAALHLDGVLRFVSQIVVAGGVQVAAGHPAAR